VVVYRQPAATDLLALMAMVHVQLEAQLPPAGMGEQVLANVPCVSETDTVKVFWAVIVRWVVSV
jgi:hypothetical protein